MKILENSSVTKNQFKQSKFHLNYVYDNFSFSQISLFRKVIIIIVATICNFTLVFSSDFESELRNINKNYEGESKIDAINLLINENVNVYPRKSIEIIEQNIKLSSELKYNKGLAESYHNLGNAYFFVDYLNESDSVLNLAIQYYRKTDEHDKIIRAMIDRSNTLKVNKLNDQAIELLNKAYQFAESKSIEQIPYLLRQKGNIFIAMGSNYFHQALDNLNKSLEIFTSSNNRSMLPYIRTDIALAYSISPNPEDAMPHLIKARTEFQNMSNDLFVAKTFKIEGDINKSIGNIEEAAQNYLKTYDIFKAIQYNDGQLEVLNELYKLENSRGNIDKSFEYLEKYADLMKIQLDVSLLKKETERKLTAERIQQQVAQDKIGKKDLEISNMKNLAEIQRLENDQQSDWITFFVIMSILLITLAVILYNLFKNKKKNNDVLQLVNHELANKNKLIDSQKNELELKNKNILDSIEYAKRIQKAILPLEEIVKNKFSDFFVVFMPKDIVSGDFFWYAETIHYKFIAVVDCTGHGVPGAFMSVIGNTMLNDIVTGRQIHEPKEILNTLNSKIRLALKQDYLVGANDGMDMSLVRINNDNSELIFSGAKRPLYIVSNSVLTEYKGDKQSIGGSINDIVEEFTQTKINIPESSFIYLTTDGYADQNNNENKKIGTKQLKEFLVEISTKKGNEQSKLLQSKFETFSEGEPQRDDVTILGIRIKK